MRVIIIDDMKDARAALRQDILDYCPELQIVGEADSVISGLKLLKSTETDIVFLDIELGDGLGFDILDLLDKKSFQVIFTTASQAYAIKAFEVAAVDYLLKPIDPNRLKDAVEKVGQAHPHIKEQFDIIKSGLIKNEDSGKIVLHTQEKIVSVPHASISHCISEGNYTTFYFTDGTKLLITKTLKEFDKILSNHGFVRTHQSYLINEAEVKEFVKTEGGYILLKSDERIPVSVRKRTEVLSILGMS